MLIQKLLDCPEFIAGDSTILRELLHPDKQDINLRYSLAHAILPVGETSQSHSLTTSEVYYILSGKGEMYIDEEIREIESGDAVYIPPDAKMGQSVVKDDVRAVLKLVLSQSPKSPKQY